MPFGQEQKKKKEDETVAEGMGAAGRMLKAKPTGVEALQKYAMEENERNKKAEEEKKKKAQSGVSTAPSKGMLQRMYEYVMGSSDEKK
jgi:hypothetical protein